MLCLILDASTYARMVVYPEVSDRPPFQCGRVATKTIGYRKYRTLWVLRKASLFNPVWFDYTMPLMQGRAFTAIPGYSEEETTDIYREVFSVLCTPMKIGTHYEGTSTNDVTFWVLHPTFDRYVCRL